MRRHRRLAALAAALSLAMLANPAPAPAESEPDSPADWKSRIASARAAHAGLEAGNGIFRVYLESNYGLGIGAYTVLTGPNHPAGPGHDVLFGNGVPGTSFMVIRDLTSGNDYVEGWYLTQPNEFSLDNDVREISPLGTTGFRVRWRLDSLGTGATVIQEVNVRGSTVADSSVEVTTSITETDHQFQIQYLWDVAVGADDGPVLLVGPAGGTYRPFSSSDTREFSLSSFGSLAAADNDTNPAEPTFATGIRGTAAVKYVCWPRAVGAPFGSYQTDPLIDVSTSASNCTGPSGPDSAVILLFPPGPTASASLFTSPPVPYPTSIAVAAPRPLGSPSLSARLTDTAHGHPVPGRTMTFSAGGSVLCTAVSGADGVAGCGGTAEALAAAFGYSASYSGGAIWAPATGRR
jgi:hypothetical protein